MKTKTKKTKQETENRQLFYFKILSNFLKEILESKKIEEELEIYKKHINNLIKLENERKTKNGI